MPTFQMIYANFSNGGHYKECQNRLWDLEKWSLNRGGRYIQVLFVFFYMAKIWDPESGRNRMGGR